MPSAGAASRGSAVERGERDAQRFWLSVVEALSGAVGGAGLVERVSPSPAFQGEMVVERLLSELRSLDEPVVLVIDDLHELCSADAEAWLERFVARLPPRLTLVLATREEPRLGLHRLRLAGDLHELRDADLRFTLDEARELLEASGVELTAEGLGLLHERTEGWAAGLRLAAISLAEHPDPERFVREFSGSERTVAGYLMAEVLERQSPEVRGMLLRTSVLERVSGPLADAMTGGTGSERMLQELEEANAFVTALDAGRSWFRYHHLFADLLRLELRRVSPEIVGALHRTAAHWHEEHGFAVEAIRHAQAAKDWAHATRLFADNELRLILDGRGATLEALLAAFPPEAAADPELALAHANARALDGLLDDAGAYIAAAERVGRDGAGRPAMVLRAAAGGDHPLRGAAGQRREHRARPGRGRRGGPRGGLRAARRPRAFAEQRRSSGRAGEPGHRRAVVAAARRRAT